MYKRQGPLLRGRLIVETSFGVPAVSVVAALGAVIALVSALPVEGVGSVSYTHLDVYKRKL